MLQILGAGGRGRGQGPGAHHGQGTCYYYIKEHNYHWSLKEDLQ